VLDHAQTIQSADTRIQKRSARITKTTVILKLSGASFPCTSEKYLSMSFTDPKSRIIKTEDVTKILNAMLIPVPPYPSKNLFELSPVHEAVVSFV
jgi:hypothetical protein